MSSPGASAVLLVGYDTERHRSAADIAEELAGLEAIVRVHAEREASATFFVLGKLVEACAPGSLRALLDRPGFEVQSHTYSHCLLRRHPTRGDAAPRERIAWELRRAAELIKREFGREVTGLRSPTGFHGGLRGEDETLALLKAAGLVYVSTDLKGPGDTLPAPWLADDGEVRQPSRYPNGIWELPTQGWHDCRFKGLTGPEDERAALATAWTIEREIDEYVRDLRYAAARGLCFGTCFHPFAVGRDGGTVVGALIDEARRLGVAVRSYGEYHAALAS